METSGRFEAVLNRIWHDRVTAPLAAFTLIGGLFTGIISGRVWNRLQLEDLTKHATEIAIGFEPHDFTGLGGVRADETTPVYAKLKQRLINLADSNRDDVFVYVFVHDRATDKVRFLADSAKPGSRDESRPGDPYENYNEPGLSSGLRRTISTGAPAWEGPESDPFGSWYSAFSPLPSGDGPNRLRLVLGVDRATGRWHLETYGLGTLVTLACWLVAGTPLIGTEIYRSKARRLAQVEALQRANTAAAERRAAQAMEEVARYQLLARTVPAGILRFDREGRALYANDYWRAATRTDPLRLGPWRWLGGFPRTDRQAVHRARWALGPDATTLEGEIRLHNSDGTERWIQFSVARESASTWLLAFVDRTRDKLLERHLEHKVRLDALAGMAQKFGADLRNALTPVALSADSLSREIGPMHPGVRTLEAGVRQASRLVEQLVSLMEGTSGQRTSTNLTALLLEIESQLRSTAPKQVHVLRISGPAEITVEADADGIRQVLLNLGRNAIEAMGAGGTLTLELGMATLDPSYARAIPGGRPGAFAMLAVADSGPGIPPALHARIMEPFFTTKADRGHAGLGLSTVARTVTEHGGFIYCQSAPGEGTTFRVYLPFSSADTPAPLLAAPVVGAAGGASRRVLVCDHEPMVRSAAELVLSTAGFHVRVAPDGVEGLCAAAEPEWRPDAIIIDFEMPGLHGFELARAFRTLLPGVPVVLTSGRATFEQRRQASEAGIRAVLEKPFSGEQLLATVLEALGEAAVSAIPAEAPPANWQI